MLVNHHGIDSETYIKSDSRNPMPHDDNKRALRMNTRHLKLKEKNIVQLKNPEGYLSNVNEPLILRVVSCENPSSQYVSVENLQV